jgi:eukaryotic-like serine/threonine-protein kinase
VLFEVVSLITGFGAIIGTLEYRSSQQAGINQLDIETAATSTRPGAMPYELLSGSRSAMCLCRQ